MKCSLCGLEFNPQEAQRACRHCPFKQGCTLLKCPNCGFEMPPEPEWCRARTSRRKAKDANQ